MRVIKWIVLHCSATRSDRAYTVEQMTRDHQARGFDSAGYNYYVRRDGAVISLRPLEVVPAQAKGYNAHGIGICYEGGLTAAGKPADTRTPAQKAALRLLVADLHRRFPAARICGHRDLSPDSNGDGRVTSDEWIKQCPCFDAVAEYKNV